MRREIGHLILARSVYRGLIAVNAALARGDDCQAWDGVRALARDLPVVLPELDAFIVAEAQSADAFQRTQSTLARFFTDQAAEQPHAVNDEHPLTPTQLP